MNAPKPSWSMLVDRIALRGFAFLAFFFSLFISLILGASALGVSTNRPNLLGLLIAALMIGAVLTRWVSPGRLEYRQDDGLVWAMAGVALLAWGLQVVRVVWIVTERPIYDWDGLYYHLPAIAGWVQAGRVTWLADLLDLPFANGYSMGTEVLAFASYRLSGSEAWIAATTLLLWPLGLLALVHLARQCGASVAWAWLVGAATAQIPAFVALSTTMYVDAAFAIAAWSAIAAAVHWSKLQSRATWADAALMGAAIGLCATVKGLGWILAAVLAVFLSWNWFRARVTAPRTALQVVLAVGIVAAVAGYWPVRNTLHTGNPIHPLELRIGEKLLAEGYDPRLMVRQDMPEQIRSVASFARPVRSWLTFDASEHGHYAFGGLGLLWLGFGLPSILWLSLRRRSSTWPRWLALFSILLLVVQPANWWSRFTLWLHGVGLPAAALASSIIAGRTRRRLCQFGVLALLIGAGLETDAALRWESQQGVDPNTGEHLSNFDYFFPGFSSEPFTESLLEAPRIARGRWGRMGTLLGGALCQPLGQRSIRVVTEPMTVELLDDLREDGVSWLVWDRTENGELAASVTNEAAEVHAYRAEPDIDFLMLRL